LPLSSGFLPTILPAEQFLSPKSTKRFPHTHQALRRQKIETPRIEVAILWKLSFDSLECAGVRLKCSRMSFRDPISDPSSKTFLPDVISGPLFLDIRFWCQNLTPFGSNFDPVLVTFFDPFRDTFLDPNFDPVWTTFLTPFGPLF